MAADASKVNLGKGEVDVNELLQKLRLSDAEKNGVFLAETERGRLPEVKWMAVAKLLTEKEFSPMSLFSTMRSAWNPAKEVTFRPIGKNLFLVQALCLGDWKRIMEDGPWIFRGCALMLEEFDGSTTMPKEEPGKVPAWIQIHGIPHLYRTESIVKQLAERVGELVTVEMRPISSSSGDFHRAKVLLQAPLPLVRFVTLTPEGRDSLTFIVKYEKLPRYCAHCGRMGHVHLECGTGEYKEEELQYGEWMLAGEQFWRPGTPRVRAPLQREDAKPHDDSTRGGRAAGRPGRGGRSGMRASRAPTWRAKSAQGSEQQVSRKRTSEEAGVVAAEEELKDTASSPMKVIREGEEAKGEAKSSAHKQLVLSSPEKSEPENRVPPPPPVYISPREKKRSKQGDGKDREDGASSESRAGSLEECRQSQ